MTVPIYAHARLTVRIPLVIRKRGGRRLVLAPDGRSLRSSRGRIDGTMVKAIARAFRWRRRIEDGTCATIAEIAATERINPSYVSRVLRLTLLAPDIVEAILDGRQPAELQFDRLLKPFPGEWRAQHQALCGSMPEGSP